MGEYEYELESVKFDNGGIVVAGNLGVWKTQMQIEPADLFAAAAKAARPAAALGAALLVRAAWPRR